MKKHLIICAAVMLAMLWAGCTPAATESPSQSAGVGSDAANSESFAGDRKDTGIKLTDGSLSSVEENGMEHPIAKIVLENGGEVELELYPEKAPETVANFIYLANDKKLYDGLTFHRIIDGFMVQGGDPNGDGTGGPGYNIKGEFAANGFSQNDISHKTGVISMARRSFPMDSAGSQFFICVDDAEFLDGQYAAFGKVITGLDMVLELGKVPTYGGNSGTPKQRQGIKSIRVDTRGKVYDKPKDAK